LSGSAAQTADDLAALRKDINALKEGQALIAPSSRP
jgi:hypothetical protein